LANDEKAPPLKLYEKSFWFDGLPKQLMLFEQFDGAGGVFSWKLGNMSQINKLYLISFGTLNSYGSFF